MNSFTGLEAGLFLGLLGLSTAGFAMRAARVINIIRISKKDPSFTLRPLGKRVWDFILEVMLQSKVIRHRPLPGLAHAFVFWGFCAFALITLNHFATPLGLGFISPHHGFGQFYFGLAGAFAFVVSISILGLAFRRLIVQPRWLGDLSLESVGIALLIFTLMASYLFDYLREPEGWTYKAVWWTHTAALLIFMPLIPHTKHMHLLLSPLSVFLSRGKFSAIPPLVGDEDFGMVTGKDVTQLVSLQTFSCVECGRCTEHCPANNTGKHLNPKEIILGARAYLNEFGPASEEPLLGKHLAMEDAFQCTTCGACEFLCPLGIEHLPIIIGLRRGAVNTGMWEDNHGTKLFLNLERNGNPMGFASSERDKFIQKLELPMYDGAQEYCLWMGCMGSYDPQGREIVSSLVEVLRHRGVTFGVLKKEKCSGDSARRLGNDLLFQTLAEQNLEQINAVGAAKKMLSICPHCVRTLGEDYKEFGANINIEHHSLVLARLQKDQAPAPDSGKKVVYHDPCYLGRYQDIYDEPRQVASLAGEVVDAPRNHGRSFCCGAGGGLVFLGEETGTRVSHERAKELVNTGADIVGAACPFCNTMFRDALDKVSARPPQLLDIAQIAAAAIREK